MNWLVVFHALCIVANLGCIGLVGYSVVDYLTNGRSPSDEQFVKAMSLGLMFVLGVIALFL